VEGDGFLPNNKKSEMIKIYIDEFSDEAVGA
jgi:hypothetical protein